MKRRIITISKKEIATLVLFFADIIVDFVQIHFNSNKILLPFWICILAILFCLSPRLKVNFSRYNSVQRIWLILQLYTIFATLLNFIIHTRRAYGLSDLIISCLFSYILPCVAALFLAGQKQTIYWAELFRNFAFLCSILGMFEYLTRIQVYSGLITSELAANNLLVFSSSISRTYRLTLFFYHPTYYSLVLAIGIICCLFFPYKNRVLNLLGIILMMTNLAFTQSRTGWIATIIGVLLFLMCGGKGINKRVRFSVIKRVLIGIVLLAISCIMIYIFLRPVFDNIINIIDERVSEMLQGNAYGARIANFSILKSIIQNGESYVYLFGGGERYAITYLQAHTFVDSWSNAIDNQFLTIFLNFGIIGLGLYVGLLVVVIRSFSKIKIHKELAFPFVVLIMLIISSFLFEPIGSNYIGVVFNIVIGLTFIKNYKIKKKVVS